jgi:hypothetical protein
MYHLSPCIVALPNKPNAADPKSEVLWREARLPPTMEAGRLIGSVRQ